MSKLVQRLRGTTAWHEALPAPFPIGIMSVDTDVKTIRTHDGAKIGGYALERAPYPSVADFVASAETKRGAASIWKAGNTDLKELGESAEPFDKDTEPNGYTHTNGDGVKFTMLPRSNNTVTPEDLGINPSGDFTDNQRYQAFQKLVELAYVRKHEFTIPKAAESWKIDSPFLPLDGVRINIAGDLENLGLAADPARHSLINPGNHHPTYWALDNSYITWHACSGVVAGEKVTPDAGLIGSFKVGDVVLIRTLARWLSVNDVDRPLSMPAAVILDINSGTGQITLDRGIPEDLGDCMIGLANDDSVTTILGSKLVMPKSFRIYADGTLKSARHVIPRGGCIDAIMEFAEVEAETMFYGNLMVNTKVKIGTGRFHGDGKILDAAGNCQNSVFEFDSITVLGEGNGSALAVMNENSTSCVFRGDTISALEWKEPGGNFKFLNSRYCSMDIGEINMPKAVSSIVAFTAGDYTEDPGNNLVQPKTQDNRFILRGKGRFGASARYAYETSAGTDNGVLAARRNRVEGGDWDGEVSTGYAMELNGQDGEIKDVRCAYGALRTGTTALRLRARDNYFRDGVDFFNGPGGFDLSGLNSQSNRDLIAARARATASFDTQSTAEVVIDETKVIGAGNASRGDEIGCVAVGISTGTAGTKTISFNVAVDTDEDEVDMDVDDDANKISLTVPATCLDFVATAEGYFRSGVVLVLTGTLKDLTNGTEIGFSETFLGVDMANYPVRLELTGLVANAADTLSITGITRTAKRDGHI